MTPLRRMVITALLATLLFNTILPLESKRIPSSSSPVRGGNKNDKKLKKQHNKQQQQRSPSDQQQRQQPSDRPFNDDDSNEYDSYSPQQSSSSPSPPSSNRNQSQQSQKRRPPASASASRKQQRPSSSFDYSTEFDSEDEEDDDDDEYDSEDNTQSPSSSSSPRRAFTRGNSSRNNHQNQPNRFGSNSNINQYTRRNNSRRQQQALQPSTTQQLTKAATLAAQTASTYTSKTISLIRASLPEPATVKTKASEIYAKASDVSGKYVREVKGIMSSELEAVLLKSTRPTMQMVKSKHVDRLIGVTYQISNNFDLYDPMLRKLWGKLKELDFRTKLKGLYVLHRFESDGCSVHGERLKVGLRSLRRTKDVKKSGVPAIIAANTNSGNSGKKGRGKGDKYFNSKQLLKFSANDPVEWNGYKAFTGRYASYVLLRGQVFAGCFSEIQLPSQAQSQGQGQANEKNEKAHVALSMQSILKTPLQKSHLDASKLILKSAVACNFNNNNEDNEECELTVSCLERVIIDLINLENVVGSTLSETVKLCNNKVTSTLSDDDKELLKQWVDFYSNELQNAVKKIVNENMGKLEEYGLFLPRVTKGLDGSVLDRFRDLLDGVEGKEKEEEEIGEVRVDARGEGEEVVVVKEVEAKVEDVKELESEADEEKEVKVEEGEHDDDDEYEEYDEEEE